MIINQFDKQYDFLSNFYPCEIIYEDIIYNSVETFYQSQKTNDVTIKLKISTMHPGQAKRYGYKLSLVDNWEDLKLIVMEYGISYKFSMHGSLKQRLLSTGDAYIEECNYWHDNFWGVCNCNKCSDIEGQNHLGNLLMNIREKLK